VVDNLMFVAIADQDELTHSQNTVSALFAIYLFNNMLRNFFQKNDK
jgi:hypothetical protein